MKISPYKGLIALFALSIQIIRNNLTLYSCLFMNDALFPEFLSLYEKFKNTQDYSNRKKQFDIVAVNRQIISETLKAGSVSNEKLTGFIQMFKYKCKDETYIKYLEQNIPDVAIRNEIIDIANKVDEWGYVGAGLNSIYGLSPSQCSLITDFIQAAFKVNSVEEAIILCSKFDGNNIPLVKQGIYSPWLYYISPSLFPIINNSHTAFKKWLDIPATYGESIANFHELMVMVGEEELGTIDMFAHNFQQYIEGKKNQQFNLHGKDVYKISHGIFTKHNNYKYLGFDRILESNNWISLNIYTGKGQAGKFINNARVGDFVYVCYGGDKLNCFGRIISESKELDEASDDLINGGGEWVYREIEPLFIPVNDSITDLKADTRFFMPSGNSTFYKIPADQIGTVNEKIFKPKFNFEIINTETSATVDAPVKQIFKKHMSLNTILYGPPGTGKTYTTIEKAIMIANPAYTLVGRSRNEVKSEFKRLMDGRYIEFVTFHQSLSYEDFIEGIKPVLDKEDGEQISYHIEDGLFKRIARKAYSEYYKIGAPKSAEHKFDRLALYELAWDSLIVKAEEGLEGNQRLKLRSLKGKLLEVTSVSQQGNLNLKPETAGDKSYIVSYSRTLKLFERFDVLGEVKNLDKEFREVIGGANSTAYWCVLDYLNKWVDGNKTDQVSSEVKEVPESLIHFDPNVVDNSLQVESYVLIIDEINRGNVSQIFGELITLLEDDKRAGRTEFLELTLPYSKEKFSVPPNLHIIGTMNTADRSVEALDTALRRRFSFEEMLPNADHALIGNVGDINLGMILKKLNLRLEKLLSRDHTIGHSFFINVDSPEDLYCAFYNKILPLLQEYFFGDFGKIGLVLGSSFLNQEKLILPDGGKFFANFDDYEDEDFLLDKRIYRINDFKVSGSIEYDKFLYGVRNI